MLVVWVVGGLPTRSALGAADLPHRHWWVLSGHASTAAAAVGLPGTDFTNDPGNVPGWVLFRSFPRRCLRGPASSAARAAPRGCEIEALTHGQGRSVVGDTGIEPVTPTVSRRTGRLDEGRSMSCCAR